MKKQKGFTLIELLVVIFIIGILAGLLLPNFISARQRARDGQRKQDLQEIRTALRLYYNDNQSYPATDVFSFGGSWDGYMSEVPQDPLGGTSVYGYSVSDDGESLCLWASLENSADGDIAASSSRCPDCTGCTTSCYYVCAN